MVLGLVLGLAQPMALHRQMIVKEVEWCTPKNKEACVNR